MERRAPAAPLLGQIVPASASASRWPGRSSASSSRVPIGTTRPVPVGVPVTRTPRPAPGRLVPARGRAVPARGRVVRVRPRPRPARTPGRHRDDSHGPCPRSTRFLRTSPGAPRRARSNDPSSNLVLRGHGPWESSRCRPGVRAGRGRGRTRTDADDASGCRDDVVRVRDAASASSGRLVQPTRTGNRVPSERGTGTRTSVLATGTPTRTPGRSGRAG